MKESNRTEFKRELTDNLEKEVIAFLNYREGGNIYIGIEDNGNIIGVSNIDDVLLKIKDRIKNNILPSCLGLYDIIVEERGEREIIKIIVASGSEKPYYLKKYGMSDKGCFMRVGSSVEPMLQSIIQDLFSKRTRNSIGKIKSHKQDLSFEQLKIYYEAKGIKLNDKFAKNLELLTEDSKFNYVAYLMSDENGISIKVAKYSGVDRVDLIENNEYGYCSLVKATKQVLDKLELENKTATKITSKERIDRRLWDVIAIREAVINAIVHNDYSREIPPKFEIFSDRLEITSAGGLPEGIEESEFFEGFSIPRNKEIMRIYKDLEMVEHLGSGIPRILNAYTKDSFNFFPNFTRMTFKNTISDQIATESISKAINSEEFQNNFGINSEEFRNKNSETELLILDLLFKKPSITAKILSKELNLTQRTIENYLKLLKTKKIIERIGSNKKGHWKILNNNT